MQLFDSSRLKYSPPPPQRRRHWNGPVRESGTRPHNDSKFASSLGEFVSSNWQALSRFHSCMERENRHIYRSQIQKGIYLKSFQGSEIQAYLRVTTDITKAR